MRIGILTRYVIGQVLRAFLLALLTLTGIIVLFMVMAEATGQGLAPQVVIRLIPYIIPGTLPYTIPVALLFAVTVAYGRMASDNEIIAVKAAGCSVWKVLRPTMLLGTILSVGLVLISGEVIPRSNYAFREAIFRDAEESFYMLLKREREVNNPGWPFFISVKDVKDRLLIRPTFKHRAQGAANPNTYDFWVQAESAVIRFDKVKKAVAVDLKDAVMQGGGRFTAAPTLSFEYPLPEGRAFLSPDKRVQEKTSTEIAAEHVVLRHKLDTERKRQAIAAALWIASGRLDRVYWPDIGNAYRDDARWRRQANELETERHVRVALACGVLGFAMLGSPVGILFARRDFLSAFISCFIPIIVLYYPLVLAGINLGKEGVVGPWVVWGGNLALGLLTYFALAPIEKH